MKSSYRKIFGNCAITIKVNIGSDHRMIIKRNSINKMLMRLKKTQKQKPFKLDITVLEKNDHFLYNRIEKYTFDALKAKNQLYRK